MSKSIANRYLGGFATGAIAQGVQIATALALLPFIGVYLSPDEIGVWYLLLTFQNLALLIDSGSSQGFVRFYSLARSGASKLSGCGFVASKEGGMNASLVSNLLVLNRYWHVLLGFIFLVIALPLLWIIVINGLSPNADLLMLSFGCLFFGVGVAFYLSASWMAAYLFSLELQPTFFRFLIIYRILFFFISGAMLLLGLGILSLGIANLLAVIAAIYYLRTRFYSVVQYHLLLGSYNRGLVSDIWKIWGKNVLVSLGGFIGNRGVLIVVASAYGLAAAGKFGISMQLFFAVLALSQLIFQLAAPRMSILRVKNKLTDLRALVTRLMFFYIALFTVGCGFVVFLMPLLLVYIDSNIQLLAIGPLLLMALIYGLEGNHSNYALAISTENKIPYFLPSIITASIIFVGTVFVSYSGHSLIWVLAVQGGAHLLYNNWKWPWMFYSSTRAIPRAPDFESTHS